LILRKLRSVPESGSGMESACEHFPCWPSIVLNSWRERMKVERWPWACARRRTYLWERGAVGRAQTNRSCSYTRRACGRLRLCMPAAARGVAIRHCALSVLHAWCPAGWDTRVWLGLVRSYLGGRSGSNSGADGCCWTIYTCKGTATGVRARVSAKEAARWAVA